MAKFSEVFALPKDRKKLNGEDKLFWIFKIEITKSKKKVERKEDMPDGTTKIKKDFYDIVYIDAYPDVDGKPDKGEVVKYYAPNVPIVDNCREMLAMYGKGKDGILSESVFIEEVKSKAGENKNEYLYFT